MDISKDAIIQNGMDIADVYGRKDAWTEQILSGTVGYMHGVLVQYLNDNGHPLAAQALDDLWHDREEQWWRQEPDQYDQRYMHGEELLSYREQE